MKPTTTQTETSLVRLDTNIAANVDSFDQFGDDGELMKSILIYAALKEQNSLFKDIGTLEINEVCQNLGYGRGRLSSPHPNSSHMARLKLEFKNQIAFTKRLERAHTDIGERIYDSVFENALFRLNTEALRFSSGYKYYESDGMQMKQENAETFQFFVSLKAREITSPAGQRKLVYDYKLSDKFVRNLSLLFKYLDFKLYVSLRRQNLEDLYIFLTNLRDILAGQNTNQTNTVSLERLCRLAFLSLQMNADAETLAQQTQYIRDAKRRLSSKFAKLEALTQMGVTLEWETTGGQRHAYTPVIVFGSHIQVVPDSKTERAKFMCMTFCKLVVAHIQETYPDYLITEDNAEANIIKYLSSPKRDKKALDTIFRQSFLETHKALHTFEAFESMVKNALGYLPTCKNLAQIEKALQGLKP